MPSLPNHQTVRLARGKHSGPESGVCVMELASMLAGEPFSDHPQCVCPIIAAYLRSYNDVTSDAARQDLFGIAADAVDSVGSEVLQVARAGRCTKELVDLYSRRPRLRRMLTPRLEHKPLATGPELERLAVQLAKLLRERGAEGHARALALAEELVAMRDDGGSDRLVPRAPRPMVVA